MEDSMTAPTQNHGAAAWRIGQLQAEHDAWVRVFAEHQTRWDRYGTSADFAVAEKAREHMHELDAQLGRASTAWPHDDTLIDWTPPEQPPLIDRPGVIFAFICVTFAAFVAALALGFGG